MVDDAFIFIMTEVWGMDQGLAVPRIEKWVEKLVILKMIEDRKGP